MKRRSFAQLAALAGLGLTLPIPTRSARAAADPYGGPYYILINAGGGWDPRFLFDPTLDVEQNRLYTEIGTVGNINFAPIGLPAADPADEYPANNILLSAEDFLTRHGSRLCVMNGVDMETNNHDAGSRAIWSGQLTEGYPSIGALIAAAKAGDQPMAYLSSGGFDDTRGLVPLTRVGSSDTLQRLAFPNRVDPTNPESMERYHSEATWALIKQMQAERLGALNEGARLPRVRKSTADLQLARLNDDDLQKLELPENLISLDGYDLRQLEDSMQQAQIAVSAFSSGIAASVNLNVGGFDTHSNHDTDQTDRLFNLLALIDFTINEVDAAGLTEQTVILVGSDFARGPFYNGPNDNDGKDHWPIGSFLAMGPGIEGNRVIGGTTPDQLALGLDGSSLATMETGGTILTAKHIHGALRDLAGVGSLGDDFPLPGGSLPLFG